jgi:hypothetical protein
MNKEQAELVKQWRRGARKLPKRYIKTINDVWEWAPAQQDLTSPPAAPVVDWTTRNVLTPPKNQQGFSACTTFAVSTTLEASMRVTNPADQRVVDPGFLQTCVANQSPNAGVDLSPLVTSMQVSGFVCGASGAPFPFPQQQCATALRVPMPGHQHLPGPNSAKTALLQRPIVAGMYYWSDFWNLFNVQIYRPNQSGQIYAHTVCVVGYSDSGWLIQNSFGSSWGNNGRIIIPYGSCGLLCSPPQPGIPIADAWMIYA